jgi:hypothetical protein
MLVDPLEWRIQCDDPVSGVRLGTWVVFTQADADELAATLLQRFPGAVTTVAPPNVPEGQTIVEVPLQLSQDGVIVSSPQRKWPKG